MSTRRSKRKRAERPSTFKRIFKYTIATFFVLGAIAVGFIGAMVWKHVKDLPDVTLVERYEPIEAIQIFDKNDRLITTIEGDEDRRVVPLSQISTAMQQAMLAAEDHHFYEHHGINVPSVVRAVFANMHAGHVVEGGSTITQQLVKNLFFTEGQRTMDRKLKEAYLAYQIENKYPKERILQMYLNQVYFGSNAYGIDRAANRYFGKTAATLDLAQAAFLAGLVKEPSELGSVAKRDKAIDRQHDTIDKMCEYGYITESQRDKAKAEKLVFVKGSNSMGKYPYYISYVVDILRDRFTASELKRQGLRAYTNLDPLAQEAAEKTLNEAVPKHTPKGVSQAALVSVSVADGAVVAMVGGVGNFWKHQFNRATNPHTAGSSFKPFVYLTALIEGRLTPDSIVEDTPLVVKQPWGLPDYAPKNFDKKFYGKIPMRTALALSRNVVSVRIMQLCGVDNVIETAREAGITTKLEPNLSLALGSSAVTPFELAGAYATFARMGIVIKPQVLRRIENNKGQVIEVFDPKVNREFQVEPVARLVDMMQGVVQRGTGTAAKMPDRPVAGKTGTADAGRDIWFVGFTPDLVTATWGGNDENQPIVGQHVTGGDVMAKIWKTYTTAYYENHPTPAGEFVKPQKATAEELAALKAKNDKLFGANPAAVSNSEKKTADAGSPVEATNSTEEKDKVSTGPNGGSLVPEVAPDPTPVQATSEPAKGLLSEPQTAMPAPAPDFHHDAAPPGAGYTPDPVPAPAPARGATIMMNPSPAAHNKPVSSTDSNSGRLYPYTPAPAFQPQPATTPPPTARPE